MDKYLREIDLVFSALADPTRRAVVQRLGRGPGSVSELAREFPMALPSFMKHVGVLETSGLIRTRKSGRVRSCELNRDRLEAVEGWLTAQRRSWEKHVDRLQFFVEAEIDDPTIAETTADQERS
ncbi:ArsR/SmtB family transcription factor [Leucobacter soli]|uniref:HTH-type transcriptional regulator n=1 Tax=Leucobacter soli TaxID=2812850 RepID=A0A916NMW9_9MICO|nr:metalloregulator ArsR/SmtB family transcription factor [Leucobacter soli]CAG7609267.1 HTH-type transcriptional regulator [Leucobacter soli]